MKYFFDTSVLVPAFLSEHTHHEASLAAFLRAGKREACCAGHSLAEVYSTLTGMPGRHRSSPEEAFLFLGNIAERFTLITLDAEEYWSTISDSANAGLIGGAIYDALLGRCALKSRAGVIYTWDADFQRLGPEIAKRVRTP